jgi:HTH-type transcriptional regulator, sugar sensing transcriptional regulator
MANNIALLQQLGFGEYEARAYIALLQCSPLNGYELAKASGVPRSNIYPVLQKLEERGAVVRLEMPSGARYAPVAATELTQRSALPFQQVLAAAQRGLEQLSTASGVSNQLEIAAILAVSIARTGEKQTRQVERGMMH